MASVAGFFSQDDENLRIVPRKINSSNKDTQYIWSLETSQSRTDDVQEINEDFISLPSDTNITNQIKCDSLSNEIYPNIDITKSALNQLLHKDINWASDEAQANSIVSQSGETTNNTPNISTTLNIYRGETDPSRIKGTPILVGGESSGGVEVHKVSLAGITGTPKYSIVENNIYAQTISGINGWLNKNSNVILQTYRFDGDVGRLLNNRFTPEIPAVVYHDSDKESDITKSLNYFLAREGLAYVWQDGDNQFDSVLSSATEQASLIEAMKLAREEKKGIWNGSNPIEQLFLTHSIPSSYERDLQSAYETFFRSGNNEKLGLFRSVINEEIKSTPMEPGFYRIRFAREALAPTKPKREEFSQTDVENILERIINGDELAVIGCTPIGIDGSIITAIGNVTQSNLRVNAGIQQPGNISFQRDGVGSQCSVSILCSDPDSYNSQLRHILAQFASAIVLPIWSVDITGILQPYIRYRHIYDDIYGFGAEAADGKFEELYGTVPTFVRLADAWVETLDGLKVRIAARSGDELSKIVAESGITAPAITVTLILEKADWLSLHSSPPRYFRTMEAVKLYEQWKKELKVYSESPTTEELIAGKAVGSISFQEFISALDNGESIEREKSVIALNTDTLIDSRNGIELKFIPGELLGTNNFEYSDISYLSDIFPIPTFSIEYNEKKASFNISDKALSGEYFLLGANSNAFKGVSKDELKRTIDIRTRTGALWRTVNSITSYKKHLLSNPKADKSRFYTFYFRGNINQNTNLNSNAYDRANLIAPDRDYSIGVPYPEIDQFRITNEFRGPYFDYISSKVNTLDFSAGDWEKVFIDNESNTFSEPKLFYRFGNNDNTYLILNRFIGEHFILSEDNFKSFHEYASGLNLNLSSQGLHKFQRPFLFTHKANRLLTIGDNGGTKLSSDELLIANTQADKLNPFSPRNISHLYVANYKYFKDIFPTITTSAFRIPARNNQIDSASLVLNGIVSVEGFDNNGTQITADELNALNVPTGIGDVGIQIGDIGRVPLKYNTTLDVFEVDKENVKYVQATNLETYYLIAFNPNVRVTNFGSYTFFMAFREGSDGALTLYMSAQSGQSKLGTLDQYKDDDGNISITRIIEAHDPEIGVPKREIQQVELEDGNGIDDELFTDKPLPINPIEKNIDDYTTQYLWESEPFKAYYRSLLTEYDANQEFDISSVYKQQSWDELDPTDNRFILRYRYKDQQIPLLIDDLRAKLGVVLGLASVGSSSSATRAESAGELLKSRLLELFQTKLTDEPIYPKLADAIGTIFETQGKEFEFAGAVRIAGEDSAQKTLGELFIEMIKYDLLSGLSALLPIVPDNIRADIEEYISGFKLINVPYNQITPIVQGQEIVQSSNEDLDSINRYLNAQAGTGDTYRAAIWDTSPYESNIYGNDILELTKMILGENDQPPELTDSGYFFYDESIPCNVQTAQTVLQIRGKGKEPPDEALKSGSLFSKIAALVDCYSRLFGKTIEVIGTLLTKERDISIGSPTGESEYIIDLDSPHMFIDSIRLNSTGQDVSTFWLQGGIDPIITHYTARPFTAEIKLIAKGIAPVHELFEAIIPTTVIDIWDSMLKNTRTSRIKPDTNTTSIPTNETGQANDSIALASANRIQNIRRQFFLKDIDKALGISLEDETLNLSNSDAPVEIYHNLVNSLGCYTFVIDNISLQSMQGTPDTYEVNLKVRHTSFDARANEALIRDDRGSDIGSLATAMALANNFLVKNEGKKALDASRIINRFKGNKLPYFTQSEAKANHMPVSEMNLFDLSNQMILSDLLIQYCLAQINVHLVDQLSSEGNLYSENATGTTGSINYADALKREARLNNIETILNGISSVDDQLISDYQGFDFLKGTALADTFNRNEATGKLATYLGLTGVNLTADVAASSLSKTFSSAASVIGKGARLGLKSIGVIIDPIMEAGTVYYENNITVDANDKGRIISLPNFIMNAAPSFIQWITNLSALSKDDQVSAIKAIATLSLEITTAIEGRVGINQTFSKYKDGVVLESQSSDAFEVSTITSGTITLSSTTSNKFQISNPGIASIFWGNINIADNFKELIFNMIGAPDGEDPGLLQSEKMPFPLIETDSGFENATLSNAQRLICGQSAILALRSIDNASLRGVQGSLDAGNILLNSAELVADLIDALLISINVPEIMIEIVRDAASFKEQLETTGNTNGSSYSKSIQNDLSNSNLTSIEVDKGIASYYLQSTDLIEWVNGKRDLLGITEGQEDIFLYSFFSGFSDLFDDSQYGKRIVFNLFDNTLRGLINPRTPIWYRLQAHSINDSTIRDQTIQKIEDLRKTLLQRSYFNISTASGDYQIWDAFIDIIEDPERLITLALMVIGSILFLVGGTIAVIIGVILTAGVFAYQLIKELFIDRSVIRAHISPIRMGLVILNNVAQVFEEGDALYIVNKVSKMLGSKINAGRSFLMVPHKMIEEIRGKAADKVDALMRSSSYMVLPTPVIAIDGVATPLRPDFYIYYGTDVNDRLEELVQNAIDVVSAYYTTGEEDNLNDWDIPGLISINNNLGNDRARNNIDTLKVQVNQYLDELSTLITGVIFNRPNQINSSEILSTADAAKDSISRLKSIINSDDVNEILRIPERETSSIIRRFYSFKKAIENQRKTSGTSNTDNATIIANIEQMLKILNQYISLSKTNAELQANLRIEDGTLAWYEYAKSLVLNDYGAFGSLGRDIVKTKMIESLKSIPNDEIFNTHARSFPTARIFFIDEKGNEVFYHDDLYGYSGIVGIEGITKSRDSATDYAVFTVTNYKNKLLNTLAARFGFRNPFEVDGDENEELNAIFIKPGCKIQIRMGYDGLLGMDNIVFNGEIVTIIPMEGEQIIRIEAQGHGVNLTRPIATKKAVNIADVFLGQDDLDVGQLFIPKVRSYKNVISWILGQKGIDSPYLGPDNKFRSSFSELEDDISDFRSVFQNVEDEIDGYLKSLGTALITGFDFNAIAGGLKKTSSYLENIRIAEDIESDATWLNLINRISGLYKGWLIYNESAWNAIWDVLNQIPNHVLTVRNYDDRQTVVVSSLIEGYYKYTDRKATQNTTNREIIKELSPIAADSTACTKWIYEKLKSDIGNDIDSQTSKIIVGFVFMSLLDRISKMTGRNFEWSQDSSINVNEKLKPVFDKFSNNESLISRTKILTSLVSDPNLLADIAGPDGILDQLNIRDAARYINVIYDGRTWNADLQDDLTSDKYNTFIETDDEGAVADQTEANDDFLTIIRKAADKIFTQKLSGLNGWSQADLEEKFGENFNDDVNREILGELADKIENPPSWIRINPDHTIIYSMAAQMTVKYFLNIAYSRSSQHRKLCETHVKASGVHIIENGLTLQEGYNRLLLTFDKDIDEDNFATKKIQSAAGVDPDNTGSIEMLINEGIEPHTWKTMHVHQKNGRAIAAIGTRALNITGSNILAMLSRKYYDGNIVVLLDTKIEPWDNIMLYDEYRDMTGIVGVRRVTHTFNPEIPGPPATFIVPDLPSYSEYNIYNYTDGALREGISKIAAVIGTAVLGILAYKIGKRAIRSLAWRGVDLTAGKAAKYGGAWAKVNRGLQFVAGHSEFGRPIRTILRGSQLLGSFFLRRFKRTRALGDRAYQNAIGALQTINNRVHNMTDAVMAMKGYTDGLFKSGASLSGLPAFRGKIRDFINESNRFKNLNEGEKDVLIDILTGKGGTNSAEFSNNLSDAIQAESQSRWARIQERINEAAAPAGNTDSKILEFNEAMGAEINSNFSSIGFQPNVIRWFNGVESKDRLTNLGVEIREAFNSQIQRLGKASPALKSLLEGTGTYLNDFELGKNLIGILRGKTGNLGLAAFAERYGILGVKNTGLTSNNGHLLDTPGPLWNFISSTLGASKGVDDAVKAAAIVKGTNISAIAKTSFRNQVRKMLRGTWAKTGGRFDNPNRSILNRFRNYQTARGFLGRPGYKKPSIVNGAFGLLTAYSLLQVDELFNLQSNTWEVVLNIAKEFGFFDIAEQEVGAESVTLSGVFYKGQPMIANVDGMKKGDIVGNEGAETAFSRRINYTRQMYERQFISAYLRGLRESELYVNRWEAISNDETVTSVAAVEPQIELPGASGT